jgi:hypothetical protein
MSAEWLIHVAMVHAVTLKVVLSVHAAKDLFLDLMVSVKVVMYLDDTFLVRTPYLSIKTDLLKMTVYQCTSMKALDLCWEDNWERIFSLNLSDQ